jgi:hypothetical protein
MLIQGKNSGTYTVYFDSVSVKMLGKDEGYIILTDKKTGNDKAVIGDIGDTVKVEEPKTVPKAEQPRQEKPVEQSKVEVAKKEESKIEPKSEKVVVDWNKSYEDMTIEELQEAILEKMRKNGPVTEYMLGTVKENTHKGSLINWVRSFG